MESCHNCNKKLDDPFESIFLHCYACNCKRLEEMTIEFEPCPICRNKKSGERQDD